MASLIVNPSSYSITAINQNTITVNYECDVILTDVKLSTNGGSTFINNTMMGTNVATFNVSNLINNTYDCVLKGFYEEEDTAPAEIPVQSITSSVNNSSLKVGETTQINTIFTPSNASNKTLTYRSDNTSIATVDEYGMITAIKEGTTQIIVSSNNNKTSTVSINVIANSSGGDAGGGTSSDITIAQSSYTIQAGQDVKVNYTSSVALSTCMLLYGPNYNDNNYSGGYISSPGEFIFYTSSKSVGTYTVKVKGRKWNDSTSSYEDYYSNEFTIVITDPSGGGDSGGGDSGDGGSQPPSPSPSYDIISNEFTIVITDPSSGGDSGGSDTQPSPSPSYDIISNEFTIVITDPSGGGSGSGSAMEASAFNLDAKAVSTVISNRFKIIVNRNNESNVGPNNPPTTVAPVKAKENLRVAKVNYDSKLTNLKNTITSIIDKTQITEADKTILNSAIDQYKTSVAELNKRFEESINNIIENKSNEAQNNATAYSKAELEILSDRIISKVGNEELSSVIEQTNKEWTVKFESSGGYNLVENSTGSNVNNFGWADTSNNNSKIKAATSTSTKLQTRYCLCLDRKGETDTSANAGVSRRFKLKPNTTYTVSGMVLSHAKTKGIKFMVKTSDTVDYTDIENRKDHTTVYTVFSGKVTSWTQKSLTFTTGASVKSGVVYFEHLGYDETDTGTTANRIFWSEVMLTEGSLVQQWSPHPNEVYSGSTIIDASGVTVNNGALRVKNNAGTTVLSGDSNGNLVFTGTAKSQKGDQFVSMDSGGLTFQDWNKSEQILRVGISSFSSNRDMNGISFAMPQYSDFIRFSHIAKPDLTNGWSSTDTQYNFMDFWSSSQTVGGVSYKKGINVYSPMYVNNGIQLFSGTDFPSEVLGAISWDNGKGTIRNMMGLYGDNGAILGYKNGSNLHARILVSEAAHPGTGDNIKSWGNWNLSGSTIHNGTFNGNHVNSYANTYTRTSAQTHCIEAEQKQVRVNFENVQLTEGKAILNIPRKYTGIHSGYIVSSIVKKGRGDVWVSEESENRFILEGTDDIRVNVEVVIKLEEASAYSTRTADDSQLCFDMSTEQPIL